MAYNVQCVFVFGVDIDSLTEGHLFVFAVPRSHYDIINGLDIHISSAYTGKVHIQAPYLGYNETYGISPLNGSVHVHFSLTIRTENGLEKKGILVESTVDASVQVYNYGSTAVGKNFILILKV